MKRRNRGGKSTTRKRKNSQPRSNDSGVSVDTPKATNSKAETVTVDNLEVPSKTEDVPNYFDSLNSDQEYTLAPVLDRNQLAFVEDEDCLDYEPFEEEAVDTHEVNRKESPIFAEQGTLCKSVPSQVFVKKSDLNSSTNMNPGHLYTFSDRTSNYQENMVTERDTNEEKLLTEDELLEEDFNPNETFEIYDEDELLFEENEKMSNNKLFDNAKVNFKGAQNIQITRSVMNPSQMNTNDTTLPQKSSNIQITSAITLKRDEMFNLQQNYSMDRRKNQDVSYSNWFKLGKNVTTNNDVEPYKPNNDSKDLYNHENNSDCKRTCRNNDSHINKKPFISFHDPKWNWQDNQQANRSNDSHGSFTYNDLSQPNNNLSSLRYTHEGSDRESLQNVQKEQSVQTPLRMNEDREQENNKTEFVARWLMQNTEDSFSELLDSLCQNYFTSSCDDFRCLKTHSMDAIKGMIHRANFQEFNKLYRISLKKEVWFKCLFDVFLECFIVTPKVGEILLIDMIDGVYKVFDGTLTDKTSYVSKIIQGLQKMGFSFNDAIEKIIQKYGTFQMWICDILLFLIAKEPDLEKHWSLVQEITRSRKEQIDHVVVVKMLMASFENYPPNKELCKKICNDILEKNLVDLDKIPNHFGNIITKMSGNDLGLRKRERSPDSVSSASDNLERTFSEPPRETREYNVAHLDNSKPFSNYSNDFLEPKRHLSDILDSPRALSDCTNNLSQFGEGDDSFYRINASTHATSSTYTAERYHNKFNESKREKISSTCRDINDRVLKKMAKTPKVLPKVQDPANFIAHPSSQPSIDPDFQCNISLHNLFPQVNAFVTSISIDDLRKLKAALRNTDSEAFLDVLKSYSDQYSIENFIVDVLTLLKSTRKCRQIYSTFMSMLTDLEKRDADYMKNKFLKVTIEVLALNLICMLSTRTNLEYSRNILMKIKDWHSLVTSKIFLRKYDKKSHMGRYIYIMNVLITTQDFSWVNEIFQAKALNLLGPASAWPYHYKSRDVQARNQTLALFFEKGFSKSIFVSNDLLKCIVLMYGGLVDGFDLWTWFNSKIVALLENVYDNRSLLLLLMNDIINYYEQFMDKYVLQAYMLNIHEYIEMDDALKLYRLCCNKGIYHEYTGEELVVQVTTNLTNFEVICLLQCYFENIKKGRVFPHNLHIQLTLPTVVPKESGMIEKFRLCKTVYKLFESICLILESKYHILIDQPVQSRIFISQTMLYKFMTD